MDGKGFGLKHALEIGIGIGIVGLLLEFKVSKIYVTNRSAYIDVMRLLMNGLLSEELKSCIIYDDCIYEEIKKV